LRLWQQICYPHYMQIVEDNNAKRRKLGKLLEQASM